MNRKQKQREEKAEVKEEDDEIEEVGPKVSEKWGNHWKTMTFLLGLG